MNAFALIVVAALGQAPDEGMVFRDGAWRSGGRAFDKVLMRDPDYMVGSVRFAGPSYWSFVERIEARVKTAAVPPVSEPKPIPIVEQQIPLPEREPVIPAPAPVPVPIPVRRIFSWKASV